VVPAIGCTEPVAVALACAKAKEIIEFNEIIAIKIFVSPNIYKNGLAVGIPNTNEVGLSIAAALGIVCGRSEKGLEVLSGIDKNNVVHAKDLIQSEKISLEIKDTEEKVLVEVALITDTGTSKAIIMKKHNQFVYLEKQGEVILNLIDNEIKVDKCENILYSLKIVEIIKEIEKIPYKNLEFMLKGLEMNEEVAVAGLVGNMGMGVGYSLNENIKKGILSDDLMSTAMMITAAAADARMSGTNLPVMSSNGSGNNGLTAILPILAYSKKNQVEDEELAKALAISHLVNSYIKHYIGRLSALCGCGVAAATGASVAIAWLMKADEKSIDGTIKNMIASTSGMICDGAKVGCSLKLALSASAAIQSAILATSGVIVPYKNGIIGETAEDTIRNLEILSTEGMNYTDKVILNVMKAM
jgi:L-cysteine desulfidase